MRIVIVLFLSLQFASNNAFAVELAKIPFLFDYYKEHQHSDGHISLFAFFGKHYSGEEHKDGGHDHGKLPFKHCNHCCSQNSVNTVFYSAEESRLELDQRAFSGYRLLAVPEFSSSFHSSIWQPPRIA